MDLQSGNILLAAGYRFQRFPDKKPADYKKCRILLSDDTVMFGIRYDTGFGREWTTENAKRRIVFDEDVKGWWYV